MSERYLNIPYSILLNPKLTSDEKFILAEIVSLDKRPRGCTASDNHFADIINKTRQTTNGIIKNLESKGFIHIEVKPGVGKKTKPAANFWELIKIRVENDDTSGSTQEDIGVGKSDTTCRDSLQVGVEFHDTTCRDSDTTNTITNTITNTNIYLSTIRPLYLITKKCNSNKYNVLLGILNYYNDIIYFILNLFL